MPTEIAEVLAEILPAPVDGTGRAELLALDDISVAFGGIAALSGISAVIETGETVAIIGPNGAGKTTLLNAIGGLIRSSCRGGLRYRGEQVLGQHPVRLATLGIGRSFQNPPLIDEATVLENVLLGAHRHLGYRMVDQIVRRRRVRRREDAAIDRAMAILRFSGLDEVASETAGGLSYGSRKLIDVARALMSGPQLLLLDEPTSGLDKREQEVVQRLLLELKGTTGLSMLVVEHHMSIVRATADRVIGLQAGTLLAIGTPAEVLDSEAFRAAVVGAHDAADQPAPEPHPVR